MHSDGLSLLLNRFLAKPLADGEMAFLQGKVVAIEVVDLGVRYRLACDGNGFRVAPAPTPDDVVFRGDVHAFLLLATQREDADALFFRRLLKIEGDTAIGLHLKNYLDALDGSPLPTPMRRALETVLDRYQRHCMDAGSRDAGSGSIARAG